MHCEFNGIFILLLSSSSTRFECTTRYRNDDTTTKLLTAAVCLVDRVDNHFNICEHSRNKKKEMELI